MLKEGLDLSCIDNRIGICQCTITIEIVGAVSSLCSLLGSQS